MTKLRAEIPSDSLWALRDEHGGVPIAFVYIESVTDDEGLLQTTFVSTAISPNAAAVREVSHLEAFSFLRLKESGKLERVDNPSVAIMIPSEFVDS